MNTESFDLNLIRVFDAMLEQRSVSRAAEAVGLSQPAMSAALARLRSTLGDALFVRSGGEMRPTPRALELAAPMRRIVDSIRADILMRPAFDPRQTERSYTVLMPDIGEVNFLPRLLQRLCHAAPAAQLRTQSLPRPAAAAALEAGAADLAVGYFPDLHKAGFYQQKLFEIGQVCIVRQGHPLRGPRLTLKQYLAASHAVVKPDGREHVFEQFLQQRGLRRRVAVELSHYMSLLPVIAETDLVATVPRHFAEVCARYIDVRTFETPIASPVIAVHQFWHERAHQDPANVWLRGEVRALFAESAAR